MAGIKSWTEGVPFEAEARKQIENVTSLPFVFKHVAVMPDVHWGIGATVGSVIPTVGAVIPAAVGVDIGCGMLAARTNLKASDLPDSLAAMRAEIERFIPVGFAKHKEESSAIIRHMEPLRNRMKALIGKHPTVMQGPIWEQMGSLGGGNHFIEVCLDEKQDVWVMLHSGSRGVGNRIGRHFIEAAKKEMGAYLSFAVPDKDLAYLCEGTPLFNNYVEAVGWAQDYAMANREMMLEHVLLAMDISLGRSVTLEETAVRCHHNYIAQEHHFGQNVWVTRKGAVRAREGDLGIIPGSMGARSYIVRGKGNPDSFCSCSHGAGRAMSREKAKKAFSLEDHAKATAGVECRKDESVIDETPGAYKSIDAVMTAQTDLVDIVHTLKQVLCVKG